MILPVIMAGGTGSRLWPMSRELFPKQFLKLHGERSMLQETIQRLNGLDVADPIVICNKDHRFIVAEQLLEIDKLSQNIILEPIGRNTAPAIALAALTAIAKGQDPILLVLAADHIINDVPAFHRAIKSAELYAKEHYLTTFGVLPSHPETGYGYIQRGDELNIDADLAYSVKRFVEKPDLTTAREYVNSSSYYWNSGMFMFRASDYLQELEKFRPDILNECKKSSNTSHCDTNFIYIRPEYFSNCPDESVDYAVMEQTENAVVIPLDAEWNDVGSWSALWEISQKDSNSNALIGDVFLSNSHDCYINTNEKLVAAIGVNNIVIVNTEDAVLVIDKSQVQDVKKIVSFLKQQKRNEYRCYKNTLSPSKSDDSLNDDDIFKLENFYSYG